jgi:hypothetical protein
MPGSMTRIGFWSPPAFLPLSGGGGSRIRRASSQWPRSKNPDQWCSGNPILLSCSVFNRRGPFPLLCHSPELHLPYCHVSHSFPRQPPIKMCPLYIIPYLLRLFPSTMCLPLSPLSHLITSYLTLTIFAPPLPLWTPSFVLGSMHIHLANQLT